MLSGCGVFDGSEIHEATLTLLHVAKAGATPVFMAPNDGQFDVINHTSGEADATDFRNTLTESARIARGEVMDVADVMAEDIDALIFPGGFGAAKNLSTFATEGQLANVRLDSDVQRLIQDIYQAQKPLGFMCIAPASVAAPALRGESLTLTIGGDAATAEKLEFFGHTHQQCAVEDIVVDADHKVVSTPAYMLAENILQANEGIEKLVNKVVELARA